MCYYKNEKYLKKVLASSKKGSTFAPAFPKERGVRKTREREASSLTV